MIVLCVVSFLIVLGIIGKINSKVYILFTLLCLGIMYYFVIPTSDFDLYRHYEIYKYISGISMYDIFDKVSNSSYTSLLFNIYAESSPAYIIYIFILSRIGGSHLLIVVTSTIVYGICFYIIYSISKKNNISDRKINLAVAFMLITINYLDISGIRNMLAISIILLGLYWDLILKKNRILCCVIYVIGILFHMSVLILVILRLILLIKNTVVRRILTISVIFSIFVALFIKDSGFDVTGFGFVGTLINQALIKLEDFVSGRGSSLTLESITSQFYVLNLIARIGSVIICVTTYISVYRKAKKVKGLYEYIEFLTLIYAFFISSLIQYDLLIRTSMMVVMLMSPIIPVYLDNVLGKCDNLKLTIQKRYSVYFGMITIGLICVLGIYYTISYRALDALFYL